METSLSFTAGDLKDGTEYDFKIRAYNSDGEESFISLKSTARTLTAVSSPPANLRAIQVTASEIKVVWDRPNKISGHLKGYYVEDQGSNTHYETGYMHHVARNLDADTDYEFKVCAITHRGRGEPATLKVRTLRDDYFAPSKPKIIPVSHNEICIAWKPPVAPPGRINGFEVLCNSKSIYFGMHTRCFTSMLVPNVKYKFVIVVWTSRGRSESQPTYQQHKHQIRENRWSSRDEFLDWLDSNEDNFDAIDNLDEMEQIEDDVELPKTPRSTRSRANSMERQMKEGPNGDEPEEPVEETETNKN